jgi:hexosaminidase
MVLHFSGVPMRIFYISQRILAFLLTAACSAKGQATFVNTLMPEPQTISMAAGSGVQITPQLSIAFDAISSNALRAAALRMAMRLQDETGVRFTAMLGAKGEAVITFKVENVTDTRPAFDVDESYSIDIQNGTAQIAAPTLFGAYHAMETLLQLVQVNDSGFVIPPVHIVDAPRFPWRGLLLDSGRHFIPVPAVFRTIDGMAAVKMNVLHLHLSENQGFRMESKRFPKLQEQGSDGLFYTQEQMRGIVAYAAARGIRVVPEFDIPGHSTSWFVGYPDLASVAGPYHVEHDFHVYDAAMDPTRETTYAFLDEFLAEMTQTFPDEYVHIGGDESNGKQWQANPEIQRYMKTHGIEDTKALQAYFNKRVQAILEEHGRKMIGWDEILHPDLSPDVVVQDWHGTEFLTDIARQGHRGLLSEPYYLDHTYSAGKMYSADPIPDDSNLSPAESKLILGGEACMWGEMVNAETMDSRIWPRAAAVAERFWSPQHLRDVNDMYRRLRVESLRLDALGLQHLSGPGRLERQMTGDVSSRSLDTFVATLEPADFSVRWDHQRPTQNSPMTAMVDAVVPDPPLQHDFSQLVDVYLHSADRELHASSRQHLTEIFQEWIVAGRQLGILAEWHPQLQPSISRYRQLGELGQLGENAISAYEGKKPMDEDRSADASAAFTRVRALDGSLTVFVILEPLQQLLNARN